MKHCLLLFFVAFGCYNVLQAQPERVIAQCGYPYNNGAFHLADSSHFSYSGGRHSTFDYNELQYIDFGRSNLATIPDFMEIVATPNNYDSSRWQHVYFDTLLRHLIDTVTHADSLMLKEIASYNTDNTIDSITNWNSFQGGCCTYTFRQNVTYNTHRIAAVTNRIYDGSQWLGNGTLRTITYNSSGDIVFDSISGGTRSDFTYNAAGKWLTKSTWGKNNKNSPYYNRSLTTNTYYPNGQLWTSTYFQSAGAALPQKIYLKDSFTYRPGTQGYLNYYQFSYDTAGVRGLPYKQIAVHFNSMQQKDSIIFVAGNTLLMAYKVLYNAHGNPTALRTYTGSSLVFSGETRWYYETYTPVGVYTPLNHSFAPITLSPNPTKGTIILDALPSERLTIRISNTLGNLIHSETLIPQGSIASISLGNEATSGLYYISVAGASGAVPYSGSFVKQ